MNIFVVPNMIDTTELHGIDSIKSYNANIVTQPLRTWIKTFKC